MLTSQTPRVPMKPCCFASRTSCLTAFSLTARRSLVNDGMVQLTAPMSVSRAQSLASARV